MFPVVAGSFDVSYNGNTDAFVTKFDAAGAVRLYSTYLGGMNNDVAYDVAVDPVGCAYATGGTQSPNYPSTAGSFDPTFNGSTDAFLTKLNPMGNGLVYSGFLGNDPQERGDSVALDFANCAYVTGRTNSPGFPTTPGAFDVTYNGMQDAFVTKINPVGSAAIYSTFLGAGQNDTGEGIAVDQFGAAYVCGVTRSPAFPTTPGAFDVAFNGNRDVFVAKLGPAGAALSYATFIGGNNRDGATDIAVATAGAIAGQAYITGFSRSPNYPLTAGAPAGGDDVIVTALDAAGAALVYSTMLGGAQEDIGRGIALDGNGSAHFVGNTRSANFPTTPGTIDPAFNGVNDAFAARLDANGAVLLFSTFLGSAGDDSGNAVALSGGDMVVGGYASAAGFPVTAGVVQPAFGGVRDAFVTRLTP
jgi:hypothetical protein